MSLKVVRKLGSLVSITKGKKHEVAEISSTTAKRLIGIDDLRNDDLIRYTNDPMGTEVTPNDLLIAWDGANAGTIGFGKSGYAGSTIARLRLNTDAGLSTPFLGLFLKSKFDYLRQTATGATIPHINRSALESIIIPEIEFGDQKRIAHLLGKVEGLIAQRKQHLQQLDDLLKGVFLEMFGDPVLNERGWEKPELKNFGKISTGNTPPRNDPKNYDDDFIEWIKTDNITSNAVFVTASAEHLSKAGTQRGRIVTNGALLVACIAGSVESIGRAALTNRTVAFNQQINAIQPAENVNPFYLYGLFKLSRAYIQSHATKGMKKILTKGDFERIPMIKPPVELQNQFATIAEKIESLKSRYQQSLTDLENLYGALSQQAFKGELDLSRVPLPPDSLAECENEQDEAVASIKSVIPEGIKIKLESLNVLNEKASGFNNIARAARASSLIDSKQFDIVRHAAAQLAAYRSPIEQLKNMSGIASAMEQLESTIKPLNLSQYDSIAKTAELARSMASSISKSDLSWLDQQHSAALKYANAPFESMRSSMEKIESLKYLQADSIAKSIGFTNNLRVSDLHDKALRNSVSASSAIAGLESLQRGQLESARRVQSVLDYSTIVPKFDTSISRAYLDAQKATFDPLADIRSAMGSTASAYTQYLASNSLANYLANEEGYGRSVFYAEDILDILSDAAEPLPFESLMDQLNELATVDAVGYETIKTILFDLLAENQIKQSFDPEKQILVFSIAENGAEQ